MTRPPQYERSRRRLSEIPASRRGYSKAWQDEEDPELKRLEENYERGLDRLQRESQGDGSGDDDYDDLSDLKRDEGNNGENNQRRNRLSNLALESRNISEIRPFIGYALEEIRKGELPERQSVAPRSPYVPPTRQPIMYHWAASNLHHNPLYFEDPSLERYGHSYNKFLQPFASAGRMTAQLIGLPYQMAIDPINRRRYSLGWIRPGDCAPKLKYQVPLNKKAALVEGAALLGAGLAIP